MKTVLIQALVIYALAFAIAMLVAVLIKGIFLLVRRFSAP